MPNNDNFEVPSDLVFSGKNHIIKHTFLSHSSSLDQGPFTRVGSTMLFYNETSSSYDEAINSCAKYGAHLVEVFTEEEWQQVNLYIRNDFPFRRK